jgi:hypothetical protein
MDLRMPIDCAPHSRWRADIHAGAIRNGEIITRSSESYAGALISLLQPESAQTNIPMRETARLAASALGQKQKFRRVQVPWVIFMARTQPSHSRTANIRTYA